MIGIIFSGKSIDFACLVISAHFVIIIAVNVVFGII